MKLVGLLGASLLTASSMSTFAAERPGVLCTERTARPNGASLRLESGRGSRPVEFLWSGLSTENQILQTEERWPLGTYAGISPYGEPVVLTIHTVEKEPTPHREFVGSLTFFVDNIPRVDPVDCYYSEGR